MELCLYDVLGVSQGVSYQELKAAYRRAALATHPDKGGQSEHFRQVVLAFEVLSDDASRKVYDRRLQKKRELPRDSVPCTRSMAGVLRTQRETSSAHETQQNSPQKETELGKKKHRAKSHRSACGSSTASGRRPSLDVEQCLANVRGVLQRMSVEQRRESLDLLSKDLRVKLHQHMSNQRNQSFVLNVHEVKTNIDNFKSNAETSSESSSDCGESSASELPFALCDNCSPEMTPADPSSRPHRDCRKQHQPGVEASRQGGIAVYRARMAFMNLKFFTRFQRRLDVAIEHHIILRQICHVAKSRTLRTRSYSIECTQHFKLACATVFSENCTCAESLGLRVRLQLELRKTRPHVFVSSPMLCLEEALTWRSRILAERYKDWATFRTVWIDLLQHSGYERGRLNRADAEAYVDKAWEVISENWSQMQQHNRSRQARIRLGERERVQRRLERCFRKAMACLKHALKLQQRQLTRATQQEKRLRESKEKWDRQHYKHMTMEDILRPRRFS